MWSLRMCILACACALAATAVVNLPCEKPPCISDYVENNEDQNKDLTKREIPNNPEAHSVTLDEGEGYFYNPTWVPATSQSAQSLTQRAFEAGKEIDGSPLWVIRARYNRAVIPGKLAINNRAAYIPFEGDEVRVDNFEVLCAPQHSLRWARIGCEFQYLPDAAIVAGFNDCGEPFYIARCSYKGSTIPGKYNPKRGPAFISFHGGEVFCWNIRVLTLVRNYSDSAPSWEEQAHNKSASYSN